MEATDAYETPVLAYQTTRRHEQQGNSLLIPIQFQQHLQHVKDWKAESKIHSLKHNRNTSIGLL
jgi:hypothetical protein